MEPPSLQTPGNGLPVVELELLPPVVELLPVPVPVLTPPVMPELVLPEVPVEPLPEEVALSPPLVAAPDPLVSPPVAAIPPPMIRLVLPRQAQSSRSAAKGPKVLRCLRASGMHHSPAIATSDRSTGDSGFRLEKAAPAG
jgi:hypothetical protein